MRKVKILFLAANPVDTERLSLDEEVSAIDNELLKSKLGDNFDLQQMWAVKSDTLSHHLLRVEPDIVHFSGHGSRKSEIILVDKKGESHPVRMRALSDLFSILKDNIRCVVLNACYSETQAMAISRHIDCVIGMKKAIGDEAAIKFAQGFYRGIGHGRDLETAFRLGCLQIDIQNLDEQNTPKILWKNDEPKKIEFVASTKIEAIAKSTDEARKKSGEVEEKKPSEDPKFFARLAAFHRENKNYEKANNAFKKALQIDPHNQSTWYDFGSLNYEIGYYQKAKDCFKSALKLDPENSARARDLWWFLGSTNHKLGEFEEAIKSFRRSLEIGPENAIIWTNMGLAYDKLSDWKEAKKCHKKALKINSKDADTWNNLGYATQMLGDWKEAKKCYEKALKLDSEHSFAKTNLAHLLKSQKKASMIS